MATESLNVSGEPGNPSLARGDDHALVSGKPANRFAPRVKRAMVALLEALEYVQDLRCDLWDFAVELSALRRLKLSNSDLRWLIAKGLIEHAIEVTLAGDSDRSFRRPMRPVFCSKTCFVLTPSGASLAREFSNSHRKNDDHGRYVEVTPALTIASESEVLVPRWDRDRQELRLGSAVIKRFKVPASNQEAILAAFEEEGWPSRIDDPLPPHGEQTARRRLRETIKSLNRNQKRPTIGFLADASGQGVRWDIYCEAPEA